MRACLRGRRQIARKIFQVEVFNLLQNIKPFIYHFNFVIVQKCSTIPDARRCKFCIAPIPLEKMFVPCRAIEM